MKGRDPGQVPPTPPIKPVLKAIPVIPPPTILERMFCRLENSAFCVGGDRWQLLEHILFILPEYLRGLKSRPLVSTLTESRNSLRGGKSEPEKATGVADGTGWVRWSWSAGHQVCSLAPQGALGSLSEASGNACVPHAVNGLCPIWHCHQEQPGRMGAWLTKLQAAGPHSNFRSWVCCRAV